MMENKKEAESSPLITTEVHDLFGLKAPTSEIAKGIVNAARSYLGPFARRRDARAAAASTEVISNALQQQGLSLTHAAVSLEERANLRLEYRAAREQQSIETVIREALEHAGLNSASTDSNEETNKQVVEPDWITRLFERAKHVTNEDMLRVWGRILAEEVRQPGTYSYRALDTLSTMNKAEAEKFRQLCECAYVTQDGRAGLFMLSDDRRTSSRKFFDYDALPLLATVGLVFMADGWAGNLRLQSYNKTARLRVAGVPLVVRALENGTGAYIDGEQEMLGFLGHWVMSEVGIELMSLVPQSPNEEFARLVVEEVSNQSYWSNKFKIEIGM